MGADVGQIQGLLERHTAAAEAGDLEAYLSTLADDVIYLPPDSPRIVGKRDVGAFMQKSFFDAFEGRFATRFVHLDVVGSSAVAEGAFVFDLTPKGGGDDLHLVGKFMNVFAKKPDGTWHYTYAIWNLDAAAG